MLVVAAEPSRAGPAGWAVVGAGGGVHKCCPEGLLPAERRALTLEILWREFPRVGRRGV